jgi:hypothetical protein
MALLGLSFCRARFGLIFCDLSQVNWEVITGLGQKFGLGSAFSAFFLCVFRESFSQFRSSFGQTCWTRTATVRFLPT